MTTDTAAPAGATPSAAPINPKYPHSGLTVEETDLLERDGWHETGLESLPPPWAHPFVPNICSPMKALAMARYGQAVLDRALGASGREPHEPSDEERARLAEEGWACDGGERWFHRGALVVARTKDALTLIAYSKQRRASALDLDAVLRAIGRDHEVSFDKDGEVRVTRRAVTPCMVGLGNTLEAAVRDLAQQTIDARERERSTIRASLDAATKRRDTLASLLGDSAETPSQ